MIIFFPFHDCFCFFIWKVIFLCYFLSLLFSIYANIFSGIWWTFMEFSHSNKVFFVIVFSLLIFISYFCCSVTIISRFSYFLVTITMFMISCAFTSRSHNMQDFSYAQNHCGCKSLSFDELKQLNFTVFCDTNSTLIPNQT